MEVLMRVLQRRGRIWRSWTGSQDDLPETFGNDMKGGDMIYDIFRTGRRFDSGTTLGGFQERAFDAVALNTNWDGHSYYRAGVVWKKWKALTEGQRIRLRIEFPNLTPKEVK
jgi:hypothetical protein